MTTAPASPDAMRKPDVSNLAMQYGEGTELKDLQAQGQVGRPGNAVPVGDGGGGGAAPAGPALDLSNIVPLDAPTQRPNEPLTTSPGAIGVDAASVNSFDAKNLSPELTAYLVSRATQKGAPLALRRFAQAVIAQRGQ